MREITEREAGLTRQLEIIPMKALEMPVTIIGGGAIGSFVALNLVKMGMDNVTVYDDDEVSIENMNCQFLPIGDVGRMKTDSLRDSILNFTGVRINAMPERFTGSPEQVLKLRGIVISSVDSMEVRKLIWETVKENFRVQWLIDPRMSAEYAVSFVMNPNDSRDIESYEKTFFLDKDSVQERCTMKSTIFTATMIAGYVAKHVKDLVTNNEYARITHWAIDKNVLQNWPKQNTNSLGEQNG